MKFKFDKMEVVNLGPARNKTWCVPPGEVVEVENDVEVLRLKRLGYREHKPKVGRPPSTSSTKSYRRSD